jgi:preprotein translocase subunit SecG
MSFLIIALHIIVCIALILIVLLQTGKGADMGAAFGGGSSQTLFGSTGATTFLGKLTTGAAVIFMLTSLTLAYMSGDRPAASVVESPPAAEQPAAPAATTEPPAATESAPAPAAPAESAPAAGDTGAQAPKPQQ